MTILCDLLTHGAMLGEQLHALYFFGRSRRRMNQRLKQLLDTRLIVRRPLPLGLSADLPYAIASTGIPYVYSLGVASAHLVSARLGWELADVRRLIRLGTPTAMAHTLEIVNLRLRAEHAVRERNAQAYQNDERATNHEMRQCFTPERLLRHAYQVRIPGSAWRDEIYKPDALLQIAVGSNPWHYFFAEVDLGHVSAAEWRIKAEITTRYQRTGLFQKRYSADGFRTLVCTTGERRQLHLLSLLTRHLDAEDSAQFGLTTFTNLHAQGLLAPIWNVPGTPHPLQLEDWI